MRSNSICKVLILKIWLKDMCTYHASFPCILGTTLSLWERCAGAVLPRFSLAPFNFAKRKRNTRSFCSHVRSVISTLPDIFILQSGKWTTFIEINVLLEGCATALSNCIVFSIEITASFQSLGVKACKIETKRKLFFYHDLNVTFE